MKRFVRKLTHKTHLKDTVLEFVIHCQTNHLQPQSHKLIKTQSTKKSMMHLHWVDAHRDAGVSEFKAKQKKNSNSK